MDTSAEQGSPSVGEAETPASPREGPDCGVGAYLVQGESLRLVWANAGYLELLDEPYRSGGAIGLPVTQVSHFGTIRAPDLLDVLHSGEPLRGEDMDVRLGEQVTVHRWQMHRPLPDHVLVLIHTLRPVRQP